MKHGVMAAKKENVVREKSFKFAVRIVRLHQALAAEKREFVLSRQVLKSSTSIGANIQEANAAISRTGYIMPDTSPSLLEDCDELCRLLFSILKTTRIGFIPIQTR